MSNSSSRSNGIGLLGLLGIVFIVLRLTEVINWSWWLVLLPFYGVFLFTIVLIIVAGIAIYTIGDKK